MIYVPDNWFRELVPHLEKYGLDKYEIVLSESQMGRLERADYCYQWDCYRWRGNPAKWVELMCRAKMVWCPSQETCDLTWRRYGIKSEVIKIFIPMEELQGEASAGDYILQAARDSAEINWGLLEKACLETNLSLVKCVGQYSREEYLKLLRGCRAVVSTRDEASTGGLCLFEGAMFNKPLLAYDTQSAREYFGNTIEYFETYEELVRKLPCLQNRGAKKMVAPLTAENMARRIYESVCRNP